MDSEFIKLDRLEFLITTICNAKCKHCSVSHNKIQQKHINKEVAADLVNRLSQEYDIQSVMTFGGEPLLFPEVVYAIHEQATKVGIPRRQIITNGFWTKDFEKIEYISNRLAEVGVNEILISVDAFHQEHIPLAIVKKVARELLRVSITDIKWSPCWLVSEEDDNPYNKKTRLILEELKELSIECGSGNIVSPQGAALQNLSEYFSTKSCVIEGDCGDLPYTAPLDSLKGICIDPNGDMVICRDFIIGNIEDSDIVEIIKRYNPYEDIYMKTILKKGVKGLSEMAVSRGLEINKSYFHSICDKCTYLRNELEKSEVK